MKTKLSWGTKIAVLFFLIFSNAYSQFTTNPPGGNSAIYSRGNVNIGTAINTTNKLNVTGNSLFTGNTTVTGNGQIRNLGLGIAPNTAYRLLLSGNSLFNGNIGVGATPSSNLSTKLLLSSGTNGISGLNFANLNNTFVPTLLNNNKTLNVDSAGNVVLTKTIDNITHNLAGNVLTTNINGVSSNSITLPLATASSNIYNIDGSLTSDRILSLNNNKLFFDQSLVMGVGINPSGNVAGQGSLLGVYDQSINVNVEPNFSGDGIFAVGGSINRVINRLTTGTNTIGAWTQSSDIVNNQAFNYHINPLGGNVGIGVSNATAQLHTKNSVRFENLPTNTNPTSILGTDSNGNVFNYNPSLIGGSASGDFWSLNGNANATASSFIGTTNTESLRFRVQNIERLQITNTGRFQVSNSSGGNTNLYFGQDAGNDTAGTFWNVGIGPKTLFNNTGTANTAIGDQALSVNTSGTGNHGIGYRTLLSNTTGNYNAAVGFFAGSKNESGNNNVFVGSSSGAESKGDRNIFLGSWAGYSLTAGNNNVFIGSWVTPNISNTGSDQLNIADKIYGSGTIGNAAIGIGVPNPQANFHSKGTARLENLPNSTTLPSNILGTDSVGNVFEFNPSLISGSASGDFWSLNGNALVTGNEFIGTTSNHDVIFKRANFFSGRLGQTNTSLGSHSLINNTTGETNTAFGVNSLYTNVSGNNNTSTGFNSLASNPVGNDNTATGNSSLGSLLSGNNNAALGSWSLSNISTGNDNVAVGNRSGNFLQNGNNNIFIGNNVQPLTNNSNNYLNIGNKIFGTQVGSDIKIGFGISDPLANFHTNGTVRLQNMPYSGILPTNILGTDSVGNVYNFDPSLLNVATTNTLVSNANTITSTVNGIPSSTSVINSINTTLVGNQFTTTINGVSSSPITLPEQHLEPVLIDSYIGTRLRPVSPNMNGFNIKKNTNTAIGYRAINPSTTGNAAVAVIGVGINDTNEYADLTYVAHFGPNYYVPKFAGNGGLLSDKELFIGTYGPNRNIDFVTGNSFTTTQSRFKIESDNISSLSYPNTRNDSSLSTPSNFIYTDTNGKFLSAPISTIVNSIPNTNIYNSNGSLTGARTLNLNNNRLDFEQISSMRVRLNPAGYNVNQGSLLEVGSYNITNGLEPNLINDGIFSINTILNYQALTTGANNFGYWTQSGNTKRRQTLNYHINPLGGNVGIGVPNATAQLHTIKSVRFQDLPYDVRPNAILGTDAQGNVYNYDPSIFGSGASSDAWLLNGNLATNPGTGSGQNFVGTIDDKDLVFGVHSDEKLRIKPSGRIQFFGWAPSDGANSAWNMYIGGGNDNPVLATSNTANLAIGVGSMIQNTTGKFNSAIGFSTLENNLTGEGNTSFGFQSMRMNSSGSSNVSIGVNSMFNNTVGINNVSVGTSSLENNINGSNNVTMGTWAGLHLADGNSNVIIGTATGTTLNSGSANILIGESAQTMTPTSSYELNIGNWIFGKNGQIAIGSFTNLPQSFITNNDYQLIVKKGIRTEKVRVDIASVKNWADYVFEDDYKLMSLKELDQYIKANGHLPNIPTSEEVVKQGVDLGEMNSKLLEKVEELTLHTIDLNKKNESQQKVIDDLILRLEKLERNKKQ